MSLFDTYCKFRGWIIAVGLLVMVVIFGSIIYLESTVVSSASRKFIVSKVFYDCCGSYSVLIVDSNKKIERYHQIYPTVYTDVEKRDPMWIEIKFNKNKLGQEKIGESTLHIHSTDDISTGIVKNSK